ncbi:unnamed protein product, partial [Staurois parvus]
MQGPGRPDIVNVGSGETRYSECRVQGRPDIVNAGSGRPDIVNAGSGEIGYSECRVLGPCIHYIWSPRTLHSLYLLFPDPAFTISGLSGPCIHYIRSFHTLHSLYLVHFKNDISFAKVL